MCPIKRLASKRKATTSKASSSSPQIIREKPSLEFSKKEIAYEKVFPTYDLDRRAECQWTMSYLGRNNYLNLTYPFGDFIYPRLVKLFYQNLTYGATETGELFFEFNVDGHHGRITTTDMGLITGLPTEHNEAMRHLQPPLSFPEDDCILEYILKDFGFNKDKEIGESIKVSALPEGVWLLDKIFKENIYPLGQHGERRTELLLALYSAHEGHFYSIPHLLMTGITKISQEISNKSTYGQSAPLPYGYLITAILRYTEYFLDEHESFLDIDPIYPLSAWISCYTKLLNINKKKAEDLERRRLPVGKDKAPKDTNAPGTSRDTADIERRLLNIEDQQDEILKKQEELQSQQYMTNLLVRIMARKLIGEELEQQIEEEEERELRGDAAIDAINAYTDGDEETYSDEEVILVI